MTRDSDFKRLIRQRMNDTAENYTTARAALLAERELQREADQAFYDRTLQIFFDGTRLRMIPAKRKARVVVLLELLRLFELGRNYTEREVNELLRPIHEDVAYLRRELVDYRYLSRQAGIYWVNTERLVRDSQESQETPSHESEIVHRAIKSPAKPPSVQFPEPPLRIDTASPTASS